jgi:hypothetical protein
MLSSTVADIEDDPITLDSDGDIVDDYTSARTPLQTKRPKLAHAPSSAMSNASERERKANAVVYGYFREMHDKKGKLVGYYCLHCPEDKVKREGHAPSGTTNLIKHQKVCQGLAEAVEKNATGITQKNREALAARGLKKGQATLVRATGALQNPFTRSGFKARLLRWICSTSQPFSVVSSAEFEELMSFMQPGVVVISRNTVTNYLKRMYEVAKARVDAEVVKASKTTYIHYAHDSWTDTSRRHCYIGVYATWIDEDFKPQTRMLRFMHLKGSHSGIRIGNALFIIFSTLGIANRIGPGTGDNASDNKSAAMHLASRLRDEEHYCVNGCHIVGCMCHIINLAAQDYLANEGTRRPLL